MTLPYVEGAAEQNVIQILWIAKDTKHLYDNIESLRKVVSKDLMMKVDLSKNSCLIRHAITYPISLVCLIIIVRTLLHS